MFGLNWLKIAIYGGSALLMIGMLWTINGWRKDSKQLSNITLQLEAEKKCLVGTSCAALIADNANKAAQAVAKAQHDAEQANIDARRAKDQAAEAEADKNRAEVKQHQAELAAIKAKHSIPCDEQRKMVIACALQ